MPGGRKSDSSPEFSPEMKFRGKRREGRREGGRGGRERENFDIKSLFPLKKPAPKAPWLSSAERRRRGAAFRSQLTKLSENHSYLSFLHELNRFPSRFWLFFGSVPSRSRVLRPAAFSTLPYNLFKKMVIFLILHI